MKLIEKVFAGAAPHDCIVCGDESLLLCDWCYPEAFETVPSRCFSCKAQTESSAVCAKCRRTTVIKHVWVATEYKGHAEKLVRLLKFSNKRSAAKLVAKAIAEKLPYFDETLVITHVPTASSRVRQRGYDQSRLVSLELARLLNLPYKSLLARQGQTRQVGTSRDKRREQLEGAYRAINASYVENSRVLIVDDVTTTGATLKSAAKTLRKAGAKRVDAAAFAQKQ